MQARYYDPSLGKFLTPDTYIQDPYDPQSFNRYAYARNNPIVYSDPSGNFWWFVPAIIGALIGAATSAIFAAMTGQNILEAAGRGALFGAISGVILAGVNIYPSATGPPQLIIDPSAGDFIRSGAESVTRTISESIQSAPLFSSQQAGVLGGIIGGGTALAYDAFAAGGGSIPTGIMTNSAMAASKAFAPSFYPFTRPTGFTHQLQPGQYAKGFRKLTPGQGDIGFYHTGEVARDLTGNQFGLDINPLQGKGHIGLPSQGVFTGTSEYEFYRLAVDQSPAKIQAFKNKRSDFLGRLTSGPYWFLTSKYNCYAIDQAVPSRPRE